MLHNYHLFIKIHNQLTKVLFNRHIHLLVDSFYFKQNLVEVVNDVTVKNL